MASRRKPKPVMSPVESFAWLIGGVIIIAIMVLSAGVLLNIGLPLMIAGAVAKFSGGGKRR